MLLLSLTHLSLSKAAALDISSAIARALERSPAVRAATEQVAAAQASWYQASRWHNPVAELRGENWRLAPELRADNPDLDFFATVSQLVELGGKRAARQAVAWAGVNLAQQQARALRQHFALETAKQFIAVLRLREELEIVGESEHEIAALRAIAERRVREGKLAVAEQLKLEAELGRLRTIATELHASEAIALQQLRQLLDDPQLPPDTLEKPQFETPPSLGDTVIVEEVLRKHPEYQASVAAKERAQHALDLEQARRIPDPAITAGYKRTAARDTLVTGVSVPLPVLDTNRGNVQRATAELSAANALVDATAQRVRAELFAVLSRWRALAARMLSAHEEMIEPASNVRRAAQVAFHEGSGEILALVDAERVYLEVRRTVVGTWAEAVFAAQTWRILSSDNGP
ncbi:MAG: TolC family protein [Candidatus Binatia bacterium]|nr:TolC family protein [Candidatus Binatia bacterium]